MIQEDKELLLRDICARLSQSAIHAQITEEDGTVSDRLLIGVINDWTPFKKVIAANYNQRKPIPIERVKPYLRPMSSMTDDENEELKYVIELGLQALEGEEGHNTVSAAPAAFEIDFYNKRHFDYRGLIPMGLALEAPEGMYNKEEPEKRSEIPIPKTVDEAVKTLAKIVSKEDRDYLLENGAISMHDSMGRWIRNEGGLWTDSELKNELKKKGFEHPDDMSNYIIEEFIVYWKNKP